MTKPHWSFWLIAVFTLIWNAMGCMNFVMQMSPAMLAEMLESHRTIAENRPRERATQQQQERPNRAAKNPGRKSES